MNHALLPQYAFKMRAFITVGHAKVSIKKIAVQVKRHLYFTGGRWKEHRQPGPDTGLLGYGCIIRKIAYLAIIAGGQHSDDD